MKWNSWFNRRRWESQMDAELQFHLQNQINDYIEKGLSRQDAESRARREFGGLDLTREECRDQRPFEWLDRLLRDFRYACRSLRKSPGFTAAAILTLTLAIGANTAIFSALEGVVLEPLPYRDPDGLVLMALYNRTLRYPTSLSYPDFLDWQQSSRSFDQIAAFRPYSQGFNVSSSGPPEHVEGKQVSSNFFDTLGVKLALGRGLSPEEDRTGGPLAAVISDRLWQSRFAGNPAALGKNVTLNGADYTIVGILQPEFSFGRQQADVYTSIGRSDWYGASGSDRSIHDTLCVAHLRPAVSIDQAAAEMNTMQEHIDQLNPETERGQGIYMVSLKQFLIGDVDRTLFLLLGSVGLLLLIACANIANLLLARSTVRTHEFAVRLALGASRVQIVRQLITESVLLSLVGGMLGLAVARWGLHAALTMTPGSVPRVENIGINP